MIAKITLCFFLSLFLISNNTHAQNFEWGFGTGSPEFDQRTSAVVNEDGDIISVGFFEGTVNFDPMSTDLTASSNGGPDVFIEKRAANGDLIWLKTFGGTSWDVANSVGVDSEGNITVFGRFAGVTDFDPSDSDFEMDSGDMGSIYFVQFNTDGEFNWAKSLIGNSSLQSGETMTVNTDDEIILTGGFKGTIDFDPSDEDASETVGESFSELFIAKYSSSGEFIWVEVIEGTGYKSAFEVAVNNDGDIYTAGTYTNTIDLDPSAETDTHINTSGAGNGFIVALSESGEFIWGADLASDSYSSISALKIKDDYIAIAGNFAGTADFDFGEGVENRNSSEGHNTFIQKLNTDGELIWVNSYETDSYLGNIAGLVINSFNEIIVSGKFYDEMDFDHSADTEIKTSSGLADGFIHQVSPTGEFQRVYIISGEMDQEPTGIAISNANELYTYGVYQNEIIFEPDGAATSTFGSYDFFLMKLGGFVSIDENEAQDDFVLYPNPASNQIQINKSADQAVEIIDCEGKTVLTIGAGNTNELVDVTDLSKGIYFVIINSEKGAFSKKIVIY